MTNIAVDKHIKLNYFKYVDLNDYISILAPVTAHQAAIVPSGKKVYVGGLTNKGTPGAHFRQLQPGDWHLFFDRDNGAVYKAKVLLTLSSPQLSAKLWNTPDYENIIVFENIYATDIPYSQFNSSVGYKGTWYCRGFMVVQKTGHALQQAIDLIEAAPAVAVDDFPPIPPSGDVSAASRPHPIFITGFPVVDNRGVGALTSQLQEKVEDIFFFHINSVFNAAAYLANPYRKKITYTISIEPDPDNSLEEKRLHRLLEELQKLIKKAGLFHSNIGGAMEEILGRLYERMRATADEELRGVIDRLPEYSDYGQEIKNRIHEIEYLFLLLNALGIFDYKTGIHLYYDRIVRAANRHGLDLFEYISSIAAHEMEHAWHYADVATKSGNWYVPSTPEYTWVKESIAEYFSLCYCKFARNTSGEKAIKLRDKNDFPYDGGYSGALLLEAKPDVVDKLYKESLDDMQQAFKNI